MDNAFNMKVKLSSLKTDNTDTRPVWQIMGHKYLFNTGLLNYSISMPIYACNKTNKQTHFKCTRPKSMEHNVHIAHNAINKVLVTWYEAKIRTTPN